MSKAQGKFDFSVHHPFNLSLSWIFRILRSVSLPHLLIQFIRSFVTSHPHRLKVCSLYWK